jgi:hypothetical protein
MDWSATARNGRHGTARTGLAGRCVDRQAALGVVGMGRVRHGRPGMARTGLARRGRAGEERLGLDGRVTEGRGRRVYCQIHYCVLYNRATRKQKHRQARPLGGAADTAEGTLEIEVPFLLGVAHSFISAGARVVST